MPTATRRKKKPRPKPAKLAELSVEANPQPKPCPCIAGRPFMNPARSRHWLLRVRLPERRQCLYLCHCAEGEKDYIILDVTSDLDFPVGPKTTAKQIVRALLRTDPDPMGRLAEAAGLLLATRELMGP